MTSLAVGSLPAHESCQDILQALRSSSLVFFIQETSYSAYITIRKRFRKDAIPPSARGFSVSKNLTKSSELEALRRQNEDLKAKFEESILESEELHYKVSDYKILVDTLHEKLKMADGDLEKSKKRNEKLLTENRELKSEKEAIEKENVELRCALKKLRKEHKDADHDLEKRNQ